VAKKSKARPRDLTRSLGPVARFLLKSQLLTVFLVLCVLGVVVGAQSRPDPHAVPYAELFNQMSVVSYRESPSDTTARFLVELSAGGKVFRQYDVDARSFMPAARDHDYNRTITGTFYRPLQVRGHVAEGLWLEVPRYSGRSLLPEQFNELYRATLDFVRPVSLMANVLGTLSGYSVGYRLATWNSSLCSRKVQERVLATPDLGRVLAREAWRRVLLEPVVMGDEDDVTRFAAVRGAQRLYTNFFRIALNDSDGFIPREAARLALLGHVDESRAMLAFAEAVHHATLDTVQVASADFSAVERWASLLVRRGHWAYDAIPPAGEERARYLGVLAWYGVAPPAPEVDRVWVGPRMLVRDGETEGFVADEIPATGVGCPIAWRARLREEKTGTNAMASAWFSDRPEFTALAALGVRVASGVASVGREIAARRLAAPNAPDAPARGLDPTATIAAAFTSRITVVAAKAAADTALLRQVSYPSRSADYWGVGIRDPRDPTPCFAQLHLAQGQAIATTGEYEQFDVAGGKTFTSDPRTPSGPQVAGLASVTVLASSAMTADSASVALLGMGPADAKRMAREQADLSVILVERGADGIDTLWVESDLRGRFVLQSECGERLRVEYY
jgi:hypothetical protein